MSWIGHFNNREGRGGEGDDRRQKERIHLFAEASLVHGKALEAVERSAIPTRNLVKEW